MILLLQALLILFFTAASAFCSCTEVALFSLPAAKVRAYRASRDERRRKVAEILSRSKSLIVTIFMYNTIVNVLLQNTSSDIFEGPNGGWIFKVGLPLFLILFFGELLPKYFGLIYNESLSLKFAPLVVWLEWLITPFRTIVTRLASWLSRLFFFYLKAEPPLSKEELQHILQSSEGKGLLHKAEAELIYGVLYLEEKQVKELMRPRNEMPIYDIDEPISKLIHLFSEQKLSEVAVFKMPEEKMLGIIHARSFFLQAASIETGENLLPYLKKPFFIPETTNCKSLLEQQRMQDAPCAWVIDEYGTPCGMILEKDLLGYIAGAGRKLPSETREYVKVAKDTIIASGTLALDELRELFDVDLASEFHMVTLGGFLSEKLGAIPQIGTTFEQENLFFRVLSSDPTKVKKVYIQRRDAKEVRND